MKECNKLIKFYLHWQIENQMHGCLRARLVMLF